MKKLLTVFSIFILVVALSSCTENTTPDDVDEPDPPLVTCETGEVLDQITNTCIPFVDTDFVKVDNKELVDIMSYYDLINKNVDVYHYLGGNTSYINIEEFMTSTRSLTEDLVFSDHDGFSISYTYDTYTYTVAFNSDDNQIIINDLDFYSVINSPISSLPSELVVGSNEYIGIPLETIISLDTYDMHVYEEDGSYYLPLYLASLFLTGDVVSVYETDDTVILFDNGSDFEELDYLAGRSPKEDTLDILDTSENYLKLYFEYFYGLDQELGYDFDALIDSYNLDTQTSFQDYYASLDQFLLDLDDIHTSFISAGYNLDGYVSSMNYEPGSRWDTLIDGIGTNKCYFLTSEYDYFIEETTMYVTVNGFSEYTGVLVDEIIADSYGITDIIIDLRCNSGGSLIGVLELMTLLTDSPIPLNVYNPQTTLYQKQTVTNFSSRAVDANFYVLTSEVTFSGGNLFATYVRDMDVGVLLGTPSSGGACAINLTVMPDGSLIVASSNTVLMDSNDETTEWGVAPDILLSEYISDLTDFDFTIYQQE